MGVADQTGATPLALPSALDADLDALRAGAAAWVASSLAEKRALLRELRRSTAAAAADWVAVACAVKRIDPATPAAGEEWSSGPYAAISATLALEKTLRTLEAGAIAPFPAQNWLTGRFRAEAARRDEGELLSLWLGQAAPLARHDTAAAVFAELKAGLPVA